MIYTYLSLVTLTLIVWFVLDRREARKLADDMMMLESLLTMRRKADKR